MLPLSEAFTAKAIRAYFNTWLEKSNLPPYLGTTLFPAKKKPGLTIKWIKGARGLSPSLMPSNYDAQATLRDRIGFESLELEMPFFRESFLVKEKDEQEYENFMNSVDPALAQEILDQILLQSRDLVNGANVVPERMIWQLLAPEDGSPKISISANGVNYDYAYDPDGEYKAKNFVELTGTDLWSDIENSDPIEDVEQIKETASDEGVTLTHMVISNATLKNLVKNKTLQSYIQAKNVASVVRFTKKMVKEYFQEELDITLVVYTLKFKDEHGETHKFYPDTMATFLPGLSSLGSTCYGKTPEERKASRAGGEVEIVNTGVAVYTYVTDHPVNTHCVCSEIVLPSFERMDDVYIMKVA